MATIIVLRSGETSPLIKLIEEMGHRIVEAQNVDETLTLAATIEPDVIIAPDLAESGDDEDLVHVLRRSSKAAIVVVGRGRHERNAVALFQGADAYLTGPVRAEELRSRLRALLRRQGESAP